MSIKKGILSGLLLLELVVFLVSTVQAQTPRRYYDWSSTLETQGQSAVLGIQIFAQESTESADTRSSTPAVTTTQAAPTERPEDFEQFDRYILVGNLLPSNPFYFIKTFQESIQLALTTDPKTKEELRLAIAGEKLEEIQRLAEAKSDAVTTAADNYEQTMATTAEVLTRLDAKSQEVKDLFKKIEEETAKHNIILEKVGVQVPDQAKDAIELALSASWRNTDAVADIEGRPAVPPDLVDRIQALKAQGLITEEEATKLIGAKKRGEARSEINKYVKEGIVPEADFLRFNENLKNLYPDEFFKIHELKRFYELKNLEANKPDEPTLARIQEFAKTYKPGEIVPEDIRKFWVPVVRLEELQNTLRPDLIDESLIRLNPADYKKFTEVLEIFKPRPEDIVYLKNFIENNKADVKTLPPEYQRMYNLGVKYGAQCGEGQRWVPQPQSGGFCIKEKNDINAFDLPRTEDFAGGKACTGTIVSAKGPGEVCSAYPSDCIPPGWTRTTTCVKTPISVGDRNIINPLRTNCPSNAHYVSFIDACVPNYTPTGQTIGVNSGFADTACSTAYHRNYPGGPCLPDYNPGGGTSGLTTFTTFSLPPLTQTPGIYPNPIYTSTGQCPPGNHWVPEPINPVGGYCTPDNYNSGGGEGQTSCSPPPNGCTDGKTWDRGTCTCKPSCPSGTSWNGSYCMKDSIIPGGGTSGGGSSCQPPAAGCPGGAWDYASCVCRPSGVYPSSCTYPSGGCGSDKYWDYKSCSCQSSSSGSSSTLETSGSSGTSTSGSSGYTQPPPGYGSCSSDQYWNGSACVSSTSSNGSSTTSESKSTSTSGSSESSTPPPPPPSSSYESQLPPPPSSYESHPPLLPPVP